ncbi:MAG: Na+/H+ antiporter subunit G [Natronospirillum sp.]|uniref:Na+/H+ antiporter subunit G n=1 Tax=Natronospirillum sp. TaxID=2812955 RepID=UPI0025DBBA18|nr:Na+/H+ antiporter subunit G [Natronospirillum sp.]MCH8551427.1 Na+/H+ antiporter subunit G [Natronospirillum sp.]
MNSELPFLVELIVSAFILTGAGFAVIGALGLARMPDFYMRVHLPTAGTTLGVGCTLIASVIYFSFSLQTLSLHEFLISMFLFITAPVSSHMMAKVALHTGVRYVSHTQGRPWPSRTQRPSRDNSQILTEWPKRP